MRGTRSRECVTRALICLFNLAIALESLVAVLVIDSEDHYKPSTSSSNKDQQQQRGLSASLVTAWILVQYASFGASVTFAAAVWIAKSSRALVLLSNALFFALYGFQWLALSVCTFIAGYSTTGIVFAVLAVHPIAGFLIGRSSGRQARDEVERQEALEITLEHEEESMYHCAEA
ncbi:hypothetical protein Gpo141_00012841 [Globisporangium polare]